MSHVAFLHAMPPQKPLRSRVSVADNAALRLRSNVLGDYTHMGIDGSSHQSSINNGGKG